MPSEKFFWVNDRGWVTAADFLHHKALERAKRESAFPCPTVQGDIEEYRSPVDGKLITSRSHRREDLKANDCVAWEPGIGTKHKLDRGWSRKHNCPIDRVPVKKKK